MYRHTFEVFLALVVIRDLITCYRISLGHKEEECKVGDPEKAVIEVVKPQIRTAIVVYKGTVLQDYADVIVRHLHLEQPLRTLINNTALKIKANETVLHLGYNRLTPKLFIHLYTKMDEFFNASFDVFEKYPTSYYLVSFFNNSDALFNSERIKKLDKIWTDFRTLNIFFSFVYTKNVFVYKPLNGQENRIVQYNPEEFLAHFSKRKCDHNGYPLKVGIFWRPLTLEIVKRDEILDHLKKDVEKTMDICGIDGFILGNMVKYLNFTPDILVPLDNNESYGSAYPNGTVTGSLYDLAVKKADISMNTRFLTYYGYDRVKLTFPVYYDGFCLIAPKAKVIPGWIDLLLTLKPETYASFAFLCLLVAFIWWFMNKILHRGYSMTFVDTIFALLNKPLTLVVWRGDMILIMTCIVLTACFSAVFQAFMSTGYSAPHYEKDIDSLQEADKSGMKVAVLPGFKELFGDDDESPVLNRIKNKNITIQSPAITQVVSMKIFSVQRKNDMKVLIKVNYSDSEGNPTLHIVGECPRNYFLSYLVFEDFPFMDCVNEFLLRIVENGLNEKWYDWSQFMATVQSGKLHRNRASYGKLNLYDFQGGFYVLLVGYSFALSVFVLEFVHYKKRNRTLPFVL